MGGSGDGVELVDGTFDPPRVAGGGWLIQEFVPAVSGGEVNVITVGGEITHAVRKVPAEGEWRTNSRFGPRYERETAPSEAILQAVARALSALPCPSLYARIDGVETPDGFVVLEVEVVEPALFFEAQPPAASVFARVIAAAAIA
jgi:glutathione synthase/RimK-type ligase-like ATP-grasp enzyme